MHARHSNLTWNLHEYKQNFTIHPENINKIKATFQMKFINDFWKKFESWTFCPQAE